MIDRRRALCLVGAGMAGLVGCAGLPTYAGVARDNTLALNRREVEELFEERNAIRISAENWPEDLVLLHLADGQWRALGMTCSHLGCQVRPGGDFLVCPCHGSTFDLEGKVVRGPAQKDLGKYGVELSDDHITITAIVR